MAAGPDVCFDTGHVLKLCEDRRGEGNGGGSMGGRGQIMHFSSSRNSSGFVRNPAGQVGERPECKRKKVFMEPLSARAVDGGRGEAFSPAAGNG